MSLLSTLVLRLFISIGYYPRAFAKLLGIMTYARFALLLSILAAASCGPTLQPPTVSPQLLEQEAALQREMLFKTTVDRQARLQRIYTPLRIANADLCGSNVSPVTGMIGMDRQSIAVELRSTAQRLYGIMDGVTILDIVPNSPAAQVGLQPRDVITGAARGAGMMPSGWTTSTLTIQDLTKVILTSNGDPITLLVRRGGSISPLEFKPAIGCRYPIESVFDDRFNAFADGSRIVVFTGLFNHVPDDREVAVIVGHELAHNILRHVEKMQGNAAIGGTAGLLVDIGLLALGVNTQGAIARAGMEAGAKAYSQEFESEADYLGLYMLARAGFDITVAPDLWRRRGVQRPNSQNINYFSTHPSTTQRAVAMTQTVSEIEGKLHQREALLPKMLEGQVVVVNAPIPGSPTVMTATPQTPLAPSLASAISQPGTPFAPVGQAAQPVAPLMPATKTSSRSFAQLYLVKGRIVSSPPQAFNADFLDTGKASITLSGQRLVNGDFELFGLNESIAAKYKAHLIRPDTLKIFPGADAKGFASFSDFDLRIECAYALTRSSGRGEGTCADNQGNVYRIVF